MCRMPLASICRSFQRVAVSDPLLCSVSWRMGISGGGGSISELPEHRRKPQQLHVDPPQCPQHRSLHGGLHFRLSHAPSTTPIPTRAISHSFPRRSTISSIPPWKTRRSISGSSITRTSLSPSFRRKTSTITCFVSA